MSTYESQLRNKLGQEFDKFTKILFPDGVEIDDAYRSVFEKSLSIPIDEFVDLRIRPLEDRVEQLERQVDELKNRINGIIL